MVWQALDLLEYIYRAGLLLYLIRDSILAKEKYHGIAPWFLAGQLIVINFWMANSRWLEQRLYGNPPEVMRNSSYSIVKLVICFGFSFLFSDLFYQGRRLAKLYLLSIFYSVQESARFAVHGLWMLFVMGYLDRLSEQIIAGRMDLDVYYRLVNRMQFIGWFLFTAGYLSVIYLTFRIYRRYIKEPVTQTPSQGLGFLMLAPIIGIALDAALRIIFYRQEGMEIESLYEKHSSMYAVVPVISVLCLVSVVYSRKIYSELIKAEREQQNLIFYKQQLADMTDHVREIEQLYDGIRSMRHDINNYVADMEQLLQIKEEQGILTNTVKREAEGYLAGMQQAVDGIFLQFSTGNPVTDVILNRKAQICRQEGIDFRGDFLYPAGVGIAAFDLGILLNNALDNAIEACLKMAGNHRFISLRSYTKGRMFFLVVENTYDGKRLIEEGGLCRTTKEDVQLHGLGMKNMKSCVERYYGAMEYEASRDTFILTLMLQAGEGMSETERESL